MSSLSWHSVTCRDGRLNAVESPPDLHHPREWWRPLARVARFVALDFRRRRGDVRIGDIEGSVGSDRSTAQSCPEISDWNSVAPNRELDDFLEGFADFLGDAKLRDVFIWLREGYSEEEIAEKHQCCKEAVTRRQEKIRSREEEWLWHREGCRDD